MSLLNLFKPRIDSGVCEYIATPGAVLLDVRTPEEFRKGRIPGSTNVPLQCIDVVEDVVEDKNVPLFVYCHSGSRSSRAVGALMDMGFKNVKNLGGIAAYTGRVEI